MALHLAEVEEPGGSHLENLVLHDLLAWRDARIDRAQLGHRRTAVGREHVPRRIWQEGASWVALAHRRGTLEWLAPDVPAAPWWSVL